MLSGVVIVFGIVYFIIAFFNTTFADNVGGIFSPIAMLIACFMAWNVMHSSRSDKVATRVWSNLLWCVGLLLTHLTSWLISSIFIKQENISLIFGILGIFFWAISYIPCIIGLFYRYYTLQTRPTPLQIRVINGITLLVVLYMIGFVLFPNFQMITDDKLGEAIGGLILAIINIGVMALSMLIFFAYEGKYRTTWRIITIAFAIRALGDIAYVHAAWEGLNQIQHNFLKATADVSYTYWSLVLSLGFYEGIQINLRSTDLLDIGTAPETSTNIDFLIFTNAEDKVITVSNNLPLLLNKTKEELLNQPVRAVLGLSEIEYNQIHNRILKQGYVRSIPYEVEIALGKKRNALITAVTQHEDYQSYEGMNLVISIENNRSEGSELAPQGEMKSLADAIFNSTGLQEKELRKLFKNYVDAHLKMLFMLAFQRGGTMIAKTMETIINESLVKQSSSVRLSNQAVMFPVNTKEQEISVAAQTILTSARRYMINVSGADIVKRETRRLDQRMGREYRSMIETYELDTLAF